jgi:hypothetical protein
MVHHVRDLYERLKQMAAIDTEVNRDSFAGAQLEFSLVVGALRRYQEKKKGLKAQPDEWRRAKPLLQRELDDSVKMARQSREKAILDKTTFRLKEMARQRQEEEAAEKAQKDREALAMLTWPNVQRFARARQAREKRAMTLAEMQQILDQMPALLQEKSALGNRLRAVALNLAESKSEHEAARQDLHEKCTIQASENVRIHAARQLKFELETNALARRLDQVLGMLEECHEIDMARRRLLQEL